MNVILCMMVCVTVMLHLVGSGTDTSEDGLCDSDTSTDGQSDSDIVHHGQRESETSYHDRCASDSLSGKEPE